MSDFLQLRAVVERRQPRELLHGLQLACAPGTVTAPVRPTGARKPTLLAAAAGALPDPAKQPWIITEEGEILSPNWIRTYLN